MYTVPAAAGAGGVSGDGTGTAGCTALEPAGAALVNAVMYCMGLASNFALHLMLQKRKLCPMCSEWCGDWAVTVMPQTGSFNSAFAPSLLPGSGAAEWESPW